MPFKKGMSPCWIPPSIVLRESKLSRRRQHIFLRESTARLPHGFPNFFIRVTFRYLSFGWHYIFRRFKTKRHSRLRLGFRETNRETPNVEISIFSFCFWSDSTGIYLLVYLGTKVPLSEGRRAREYSEKAAEVAFFWFYMWVFLWFCGFPADIAFR